MNASLVTGLASLLIATLGFVAGLWLARFFYKNTQQPLLNEIQRLQDELMLLRKLPEQIGAAQARSDALQHQLKEKTQQLEKAEGDYRALTDKIHHHEKLLAEANANMQAAREQQTQQALFVDKQMKAMQLQFEQQAARILEEKTQKFTEQNRSGIDAVLNPLRDQIKDFREKVDAAYGNEARERFALKEEILKLESLNKQISDEAANLARALKGDKKLQGNWGEIILLRVLEQSGLREGHEYEKQLSITDEEGQRRLPDVIIRLPENRDIIIDSKVSLVDYERYCSSEDNNERQAFLKQHVSAIRNHIRLLSDKAYENLPGIRTLDFVFLFMPVEAAFMLAVEHDPDLFQEAFKQKIIIVSPTTLLATLRTVESIWRYERQNKNAEKIAKEAGALHDKFHTLAQYIEDIGKAIERSRDLQQKAINSLKGHGGLTHKVDRLRLLGAKTKKTLDTEKYHADSPLLDDANESLPDNLPEPETLEENMP